MTDLESETRMKVREDEIVGDSYGRRRRRRKAHSYESKYDDLRQLETAIREAYVAKELKAQTLEAEALRVAEEAQERLRNELFKLSVEEASRMSEEEDRLKKSSKIIYGLELQAAITSKENERVSALEVERKERKILEEVSGVIEDAQRSRKLFEKFELAGRTARGLQILQEFKEIRSQKEVEESRAAGQRDLNYLKEIDARIEKMKIMKKERKLAREKVIEIVSKNLLESMEKRLEIEAIIADLVVEEKLLDEEVKLRENKERDKSAREDAAAEIERHKIIIEKRKLRHAIEEEEFAGEIMRRVLEDLRIERLTVEAKRRKRIEYRKALDEIIEERRAKRVEEMKKLEASLDLERQRGEAFRERVKEMREILLIEHAGNVSKFIAKEALSDRERIVLGEIMNNFET